jgi:hypothetical protein
MAHVLAAVTSEKLVPEDNLHSRHLGAILRTLSAVLVEVSFERAGSQAKKAKLSQVD